MSWNPPSTSVGGDGAYTALPGYDYTTGLGTLDINVMNNDLKL